MLTEFYYYCYRCNKTLTDDNMHRIMAESGKMVPVCRDTMTCKIEPIVKIVAKPVIKPKNRDKRPAKILEMARRFAQ